MSLSKEEVTKIAHLARIQLEDAQTEKLAAELTNIVGWIETLNEVNTDDAEALDHAVSFSQRLREDVVDHHNTSEDVLKNAKDKTLDFFSVPKVIE